MRCVQTPVSHCGWRPCDDAQPNESAGGTKSRAEESRAYHIAEQRKVTTNNIFPDYCLRLGSLIIPHF